MILWIASLQPVVVGAVLIWAATGKLFSRYAATAARRSALTSIVGEKRALPAYRMVGVAELVIGAALVLPPALRVEALVAAALHIGFLGYLGYARIAAPESSCGCLSAQRAPIGWRGFARAGVLLIAALAATTTTTAWHETLLDRPLAGATLLVAEAILAVTLSAELDAYWLLPLRRLRVRLTHPLPSGSFDVPLASTVEQLQRSGVYGRVAAFITSDVLEHWDEGDWRIVSYAARFEDRLASAVFAVPRLRYEPAAVRVAIVEDQTNATLLSLDSVPDPIAEAGWPVPAHAG